MRKLYVWGRGEEAKRLFERQNLLVPLVDGVIESGASSTENEFFYDKKVISVEDVELSNSFIIIATQKYYPEIKEYLIGKGQQYMDDFCDCAFAYRKVMAAPEFGYVDWRSKLLNNVVKEISKWIPQAYEKVMDNPLKYREIVTSDIDIYGAVLECCADKERNIVKILDAEIEYDSLTDLAVIFRELLLSEEYYFDSDNDEPMIIDAGANIGLAIFYFKHIYPRSQVIAFEPNEKVFGILQRNVSGNHWEGVTLYNYALSENAGTAIFYVQKSGMAGSLTKRNQEGITDKVDTVSVNTVVLNDYISGHIDLLKMDIEGAETVVIEKMGDKLLNVSNIFVEFHEGRLKGNNSIAKILNILERYGFDVNVGKALMAQHRTAFRPLTHVGTRISEVIYASRRT